MITTFPLLLKEGWTQYGDNKKDKSESAAGVVDLKVTFKTSKKQLNT
jgi:hypothetical protein